MCLKQAQISVTNKGYENTTLNDISGIIFPELVMNIMSCHGFVNENNSTVIL